MSKLVRFGVSLEKVLLDKFSLLIKGKNYPNRSEAFRGLLNKITDLQHDFQKVIISTQQIHLDHSNSLEITAVRENPKKVQRLADILKLTKGIKYTTLSMSSTGKGIE